MARMASGRRLRKKIILWSVLILGGMALGVFVFRDDLSLEYHKRKLVAAKARHWRLTTKGYSGWDHISEVLRGHPVSADQVVAAWKRHEEALVRRGFLSRETYVARNGLLPSRSANPEYNHALARMEGTCPWWSVSRVGTNLVVTGCARGLADWKQLAPEAGLKSKSEMTEGGQKVKKGCWRKRRHSRLRETLAGKVPSGYSVDDEFVRTRILMGIRRSPPPGGEPKD